MSFLADQFYILWTCLIYPHLVLFTLHSHLHLHSLCTATRYIYKCRKYKGEQWLILCFLLIWIFLFRANLLPPGHIWLCNCCWQILQLVLLKIEVWTFFICSWKYTYLAHRNDSVVFQHIRHVEAAANEGAQEVFKCGQSSSLYSRGFHFSQCPAQMT